MVELLDNIIEWVVKVFRDRKLKRFILHYKKNLNVKEQGEETDRV